jgi:hypothetical protein
MSFLFKNLLLILLLINLSPNALAGETKCAADYAAAAKGEAVKSTGFVLDKDMIKKIRNYCRTGEYPLAQNMPLPAELAIYMAYQCAHAKHDYFDILQRGAQTIWNSAAGTLQGDVDTWARVQAAHPSFEGVPPKMKKGWGQQAKADFRHFMREVEKNPGNEVEMANLMVSLKMGIPFLKEEQLKDGIRLIASQRAARLQRVYQSFYSPRLFQFYKEQVRQELGLSYIPLKDIDYLKDQQGVKYFVLSVDRPADMAGVQMRDGVYIKNIFQARAPVATDRLGANLGSTTLEWEEGGKNYKAVLAANAGKGAEEFAPNIERLDYAGMWKDKKLTGLIFAGSNMGSGDAGAHYVMNEYKSYYRSKGFRFSQPKEIKNFEKYIGEEIRNGQLDYIVKEAHSQGGSASLVRLSKEGQIATGRKKLADGKEEVVNIFYPNQRNMQTKTQDFLFSTVAEDIAERSRLGGKQLFFLDTSCSGIYPACALATTTQDPNLVVAGSNMGLSTFTDTPESPIYHVLEGLRKGKAFSQIKEAMVQHNAEDDGIYIFPHEAQWTQAVHSGNNRAIEVKADFFEDGKKVDVETVGR